MSRLAAVVITLGCSGALGCGGLPQPPARAPTTHAAPAGMARDPAPPLRLRPGDVLEATVETALGSARQQAVVEADGDLFISGVGRLRALGRSLDDAERGAMQLLQERDRLGRVYLQLRGSAGQRVTVLGAVQRQGSVELAPGMRMADVVAAAGGPLQIASSVSEIPIALGDLSSAVVVRDGSPLPISVALALRGDPAHNVHAHPGDHVYVPLAEERSVRVMGQVGTPIVFAPPPGLRLTEALSRAGGITAGGDKSDVRLLRGAVERPAVFSADVAATLAGEAPDVELSPGDFIFVTDDPLEDFSEVLLVLTPLAAVVSGVAFTTLFLTL